MNTQGVNDERSRRQQAQVESWRKRNFVNAFGSQREIGTRNYGDRGIGSIEYNSSYRVERPFVPPAGSGRPTSIATSTSGSDTEVGVYRNCIGFATPSNSSMDYHTDVTRRHYSTWNEMFPPPESGNAPMSLIKMPVPSSSPMQSTWPWSSWSFPPEQHYNFNSINGVPSSRMEPFMPNVAAPHYYNGSQSHALYTIPNPQFGRSLESLNIPALPLDNLMTPPTSHQPINPTSPRQSMPQSNLSKISKKTVSLKHTSNLEIKMVSSKVMIGKRRGGRTLPTGVIKKTEAGRKVGNSEAKSDGVEKPWSRYMAEVERYRKQTCSDDVPNRSLVK